MGKIQTVAILGAGATGSAMAAVLTHRGYRVRLYNRSPQRLEPIQSNGGIEMLDGEAKGLQRPELLTCELEGAVRGADLILVMVTSLGHRDLARSLAPLLRDGQTVVLCSGGGGSLEFARIWAEEGLEQNVLLGETSTMPLAARERGGGRYTMKLPSTPRTAAFPGRRTEELCSLLEPICHPIAVEHVLDSGINNPNWLIHPIPMVLNYAEVERQKGYFSLMNEGMTPSVLTAMDAFDAERMSLLRALELPVLSVDDIYLGNGSGPWVYREPGEPMGFKDKIHDRYLEEDIPFGSMVLAGLGDLLNVQTPIMDAVNTLACVLTGRDFYQQARTPERLGLAGLSVKEIRRYLMDGRV